mmetsp:Transcript_13663/g.38944  ORF Transcript_13663/g.38944 Transcript_13663/m.38944 type:complete len:206 (-) Transcript_13663:976-1593(-)
MASGVLPHVIADGKPYVVAINGFDPGVCTGSDTVRSDVYGVPCWYCAEPHRCVHEGHAAPSPVDPYRKRLLNGILLHETANSVGAYHVGYDLRSCKSQHDTSLAHRADERSEHLARASPSVPAAFFQVWRDLTPVPSRDGRRQDSRSGGRKVPPPKWRFTLELDAAPGWRSGSWMGTQHAGEAHPERWACQRLARRDGLPDAVVQ